MTGGGYTNTEAWNLQLQARIAELEAEVERLQTRMGTMVAETKGLQDGSQNRDQQVRLAELEAELASERVEPPSLVERCETCRFWGRWPHLNHLGSCKRFPPQWTGDNSPVKGNEVWGNWSYPVLRDDAGCGEWRAREGQS